MLLVQWMRRERMRFLERIKDPVKLAAALAWVEYPLIFHISLEFGLFKTYAIPSVSKILAETGQFTKSVNSCLRRYDDTNLIINEMIAHGDLDHPRSLRALRRLNHIHGHYPIKNEDHLYTLSVFICEPIAWTAKYGYRDLTVRERDAVFSTWVEIGSRMGIEGIPKTYEEMLAFYKAYESKHFRYSKNNRKVADGTFALLLKDVPPPLRPYVTPLTFALMSPLLRTAMGYQDPSEAVVLLVSTVLMLRKSFVKYLLPPRPFWLESSRISKNIGANGKYHTRYHFYGEAYPEGYRIEHLGPPNIAKTGTLASVYDTKSGKKKILETKTVSEFR